MTYRILAVLGFLALSFGADPAWTAGGTGAPPIDEGAISVTLHVDAAAPAGGNGTAQAPFHTLQAAFNRAIHTHNAAGQGVRVLIAPGIYREGTPGSSTMLTLPSPFTAAPVVIEGAGWSPGTHSGGVVIAGSEVWTDWTNEGGGIWTKAWPYTWGVGPNNTGGGNPPEPMLRYELVHVNGATYYQFLGPTDPNLNNLTPQEGAFWVDETAGKLFLRPPPGLADLNAATVEVTTKRRILHHWRPQSNTTPMNVALRNLVFRHGSGGMNSGAVMLQNMTGVTIEDCVFRDNKQMGVTLSGVAAIATIRRTDIIRNGEMGAGLQATNMLVEDTRFSENARFADVIMYYGWGYGGVKIGHTRNATFRRVEASRNYGMGLWFDTGNVGCLVEDSALQDNTSMGLWSENNNRNNIAGLGTTPTVVLRRSVISGNFKRSPQATVTGGGFYITESENTVIEDSILYDNTVQFRLADGPGRGPIANTLIRRSVLASRQGQVQRIYNVGYGTRGWVEFFDTLSPDTDRNVYYYSGSNDGVTAFTPQPQPDTIAAFYTRWQSISLDLAEWKQSLATRGAEQNSQWSTNYVGQPLVVVEPWADFRQEDGGTVPGFRLRRVATDVSAPLTVHYTAGGTAVAGTHYVAFPGTVTFAAGQSETTIPFTPIETGIGYGELIVSLALPTQPGYVAPGGGAEFLLEDTISGGQPRVFVSATTPEAREEGLHPAVWTISRTGSTEAPLTISYTLGGSALPSRYVPLPGTVTFPAGEATAVVVLTPVDDDLPQLTETVILQLVAGSGYGLSGVFPTSATVFLLDNDIAAPVREIRAPESGQTTVPVVLHNPDPLRSQTFTISLPIGEGYIYSDSDQPGGPEYAWTELKNGANGSTQITALDGTGNAISYALPLGFSFPLYGNSYTQVHLAVNGTLYFGTNMPTFTPHLDDNQLLPSTIFSMNRETIAGIAFFWDNLSSPSPQLWDNVNKVWYPNPNPGSTWIARPDSQTWIVQYDHFAHWTDQNRRMTAQVILKANGEMTLVYKSTNIPYQLGATIGLQGEGNANAEGMTISHNSDYIRSEMAIRLRPAITWLRAASGTMQVTVPPGSSSSFSLTLDTAGLDAGEYSGFLEITSDLAEQPALNLPVELIISDLPPPAAPTEVTSTALSADSIQVAWNHDGEVVEFFRILRSASADGPFEEIATVDASTRGFIDGGLLPHTVYFYQIVSVNVLGASGTSAPSTTTTLVPSGPPTITNEEDLQIEPGIPFQTFLETDREIRAFFKGTPTDSLPGASGLGWATGWQVQATVIATATALESASLSPLLGGGEYLSFTGLATAEGKRTFVTRSYTDDPVSRVQRQEPHRISFLFRADDLAGFTDTNDRLYLWDRLEVSNGTHNTATGMTWGLVSAGAPREWRYYAGTTLTSTGVRILPGRVYQFLVELDPAQNRWKLTVTDKDWQSGDAGVASFHTANWVSFRNVADNPQTVGGHFHAGLFLQTAPQEARFSLDSLRITRADWQLLSDSLPAGVLLDAPSGRFFGALDEPTPFSLGASNADGQSWLDFFPVESTEWENWQQDIFSSEILANPALESTHWGALADPDGDGIPNLLEYALGGDPLVPASSPLVVSGIAEAQLQMSFQRARADLDYLVEGSSDLVSWQVIATNPGVVGEVLTVTDPADPAEHPRRFLRLRVRTP